MTRSMTLAGVRVEERPQLAPDRCAIFHTNDALPTRLAYSGPFLGRPSRAEVRERTGGDIARLLVSSHLFNALARGAEARFGHMMRPA